MKDQETKKYKLVADLAALLPEVPEETIVSRKVFSDDLLKVTLFGFAAGEELTEHTAALPATLHFLSGEATLTLGEDIVEAGAGTWVQMAAHLPHTVVAKTAVSMLLVLTVTK
ncbi:MAG: cupin [Chloroflexi bacterium]|nr:cupin [Chloroflexota bacterium]